MHIDNRQKKYITWNENLRSVLLIFRQAVAIYSITDTVVPISIVSQVFYGACRSSAETDCSVKDQIGSILGFVGHEILVTATQIRHCGVKAAFCSHQHYVRISASPHSCQHLPWSVFILVLSFCYSGSAQ